MNITKQQYIESILYFAEKYDKKTAYEIIVKEAGLPRATEMIVYLMFINQHINVTSDDKVNYENILNYSITMNLHGFVNFL